MARGIWKNGLLKIFLTRSFLGFIFRPLLYSCEENIHYTFLCPLTDLARQITTIRDCKKKALANYWLVEVPRTLLEELFLADGDNRRKWMLPEQLQTTDGSELAYLTQGYVVAHLGRMLAADDLFRSRFGISKDELRNIIYAAFGEQSRSLYYESRFSGLLASVAVPAVDSLYLQEMMGCLTDTVTVNLLCGSQAEQIQPLVSFCLWKLLNAQQHTLTLLDFMEGLDAAGVIATRER